VARRVILPVIGRLDSAGGVQRGTITIYRDADLVTVRPLRRKRTYTLPLSTVADYICRSVIYAELAEKRRLKKARRKKR
jgi:hypothetical protein